MIEHLNNILKDIELLKNSNDYNLDNKTKKLIKNNLD